MLTLLCSCSKHSAPSSDDNSSSADNDDEKVAAKKKSKKKLADDDNTSTDDDEKVAADKKSKKKPADDDSTSNDGQKKIALAANEAEVARYPDEKKIDPPKAVKLVWAATNIRAAPNKTSKLVAVVVKGTEVTQLAQRPSGHFLVSFPDPKNSSETLMGWIFKEAITGSPMKLPLVGGKCPTGYVVDIDRCAKKCRDIGDCANGYFCGGQGVQYCIYGE